MKKISRKDAKAQDSNQWSVKKGLIKSNAFLLITDH
jgi:hypothetical protein